MKASMTTVAALTLLGVMAGCAPDESSNDVSNDAIEGTTPAACASEPPGTLVCQRLESGGTVSACIDGTRFDMKGRDGFRGFTDNGVLHDSRNELLYIGGGLGYPNYRIEHRTRALSADRGTFTVETATFTVRSINDFDRVWESAELMEGIQQNKPLLKIDPALDAARTPEERAAILLDLTRKMRDQIVAECVGRGGTEKQCKEGTYLQALYLQILSADELLARTEADRHVTVSAKLTCTTK